MQQLKASITIILFTLSCFLLNETQANSSFSNALPKVQKDIKRDKSSKKSILFYLKKIKKNFKKISKSKKKRNYKSSKEKRENRYGTISLWSLIFCGVFLLLTPNLYILGPLLAIVLNLVSFFSAKHGVMHEADENPKLANTMFNINLGVYALAVLIVGWFIILSFA